MLEGRSNCRQNTTQAVCLCLVSLGKNEDIFLLALGDSLRKKKCKPFHSEVQGSAEARHRPNYVKYSDLLVQKLNAVLQLSVYVPGAMRGYKTCFLRFPSGTCTVSALLGLALLYSCRAEALWDYCIETVLLKKWCVMPFRVGVEN